MKVVGSDYMHKRPAAQRLTIMLLVAAARSPDRNLNLLSGRLCFLTQLLNVGERLVPEVGVIEVGVMAAVGEEFLVGAFFDDAAVIHDNDAVGVADG